MNPDALDPKYRAGFEAGASTSEAALRGTGRLLEKAEKRIAELETALSDIKNLPAFRAGGIIRFDEFSYVMRQIYCIAENALNSSPDTNCN